MPTKFNIVKLAVEGLQEATDFYTSCFGMVPGPKHNEWEWALTWPETESANTEIILYCDPEGQLPHSFGPSWLMFEVDNRPNLVAELEAAGARDIGEPIVIEDYGVEIIILSDPFGNVLELIVRRE